MIDVKMLLDAVNQAYAAFEDGKERSVELSVSIEVSPAEESDD